MERLAILFQRRAHLSGRQVDLPWVLNLGALEPALDEGEGHHDGPGTPDDGEHYAVERRAGGNDRAGRDEEGEGGRLEGARRSVHALHDPIEVLLVPVLDRQRDHLRHLVRMDRHHPVAQRRELLARRLEHEQRLLLVAELPLPSVDGAHAGEDVPAGGELLLDQDACDARRLVRARRGDQHDEGVRHSPSSLATISFMISLVPPAMVSTRTSRQARATSFSITYPIPPWSCMQS